MSSISSACSTTDSCARAGIESKLETLIASIRVGLSLPDAVATLAESAPPALRPAFAVFARDLQGSGRFETSLDRLKDALADPIGPAESRATAVRDFIRTAEDAGLVELDGEVQGRLAA